MEEETVTRYRKLASECRVHASRTSDPDRKARWLELAEQWERFAERLRNEGPSIHSEASEQQKDEVG